MKQTRVEYIDICKGIAIILVVMGHVLYFDIYGPVNAAQSQLFRFIYSFHMPLFVFLSGLVTNYSPTKRIDVYEQFRNLIIPGCIVGLPYAVLSHNSIIDFFSDDSKLGYWYVFALFIWRISTYPLALLNNKTLVIVVLCLFVVWFELYRHLCLMPSYICDALCLNHILQLYPYFLLGSIVRKFCGIIEFEKQLIKKLFTSTRSIFSDGLLKGGAKVICCIVVILFVTHQKWMLDYVIALCAILLVILFCKYIPPKKQITSLLITTGKCSLSIYLFHYYFTHYLHFFILDYTWIWFRENGNFCLDLFASIIPTLMITAICCYIHYLIEKKHMIKKIIFNK